MESELHDLSERTHMTLDPSFLEEQKEKLLDEEARLVDELAGVAHPDPEQEGDFIPTFEDLGTSEDSSGQEVAAYEQNIGADAALETRLRGVRDALKKMDKGTYGLCEVDGAPIDRDRLMVQPEATRCVEHAEELDS